MRENGFAAPPMLGLLDALLERGLIASAPASARAACGGDREGDALDAVIACAAAARAAPAHVWADAADSDPARLEGRVFV